MGDPRDFALSSRLVQDPSGPRTEIGSDGWAVYGDGPNPVHSGRFPARSEPAPDFGACSCCERLPAGTTARVLALLDPDHLAARVLRGAMLEDGS